MNSILKYSPILSGLLILLGVIKLSVFYNYFDIDIISYLSLTDILVAFLSDLHTLAIVIVIAILHACISHDILFDSNNEKVIKIEEAILKIKVGLSIFFGVLSLLFIIILTLQIVELALWNIYMVIFCSSNFVSYSLLRQDPESSFPKFDFAMPRLFDGLQVLILSSTIVLLAYYQINDVYKSKKVVSLRLNDGREIKSSKDVLYLGKVGEYHYLFNAKNNSKMIVYNDQIKEIKIDQ